jgi:hypothetical protein
VERSWELRFDNTDHRRWRDVLCIRFRSKAKKVNKRAFLLTLASEKADIGAKAINGSFGTLKRIVFMAIITFLD